MIILSASNITKKYGNLDVLKGVNIAVNTAEIVTIVGKSGVGKSTLLHILGTLDTPDSGALEIAGKNAIGLNPSALAHLRSQEIGFIFQFHHLLSEFTAQENVCIPALIIGKNKRKSMSRAAELLKYLGLSDRLAHKPQELSGGEQQRVAVARALMNEPKIIFADEPTGNLDSQTSSEMHRLFSKLKRDLGQTFVIVTHNKELSSLSDRSLEMKDGVLLDE